ncbi:MAG: pentapeptide repeat-containing protein [Amaricoccus sp.]
MENRSTPRPEPNHSGEDDRKEIEQISASAQTAWFSLLSFLAFYFIVAMSTVDADYLAGSKETNLPLINVSIPTERFFFAAPIVAMALYFYLHFLCIVLWGQARRARPETLRSALSASLIGSIALSLKPDTRPHGIREGRMERLASLGALCAALLLWAAQPMLLLLSLSQARAAATVHVSDAASFFAALLTVRWATVGCLAISVAIGTVSLLQAAAIRARSFARAPLVGMLPVFAAFATLAAAFLTAGSGPAIDVERVTLARLGDDWKYAAERREQFRAEWCKAEGVSAQVCAERPLQTPDGPKRLAYERREFCQIDWKTRNRTYCAGRFLDLDTRFAIEWDVQRRAELAKLPQLDLDRRDLQGTNASNARLTYARLEQADLSHATLTETDLEGAILIEAKLTGTYAQNATFDRADLTRAHLETAVMPSASFEHAALNTADLTLANLTNARLDDVDLSYDTYERGGATLLGAILVNARLNRANLAGANLDGAILDGADLSDVMGLTQAQLDRAVGDRRTLLPRPPFPEGPAADHFMLAGGAQGRPRRDRPARPRPLRAREVGEGAQPPPLFGPPNVFAGTAWDSPYFTGRDDAAAEAALPAPDRAAITRKQTEEALQERLQVQRVTVAQR